ncbi:MAG: hypothetical protein AAFX94_12410 [Myxococcota bacterium]
MSEVSFQIEVPLGPNWSHIELLRTSVLHCLVTVFQNYDYCSTLSMVAGELLENAVKYGDWSRRDPRAFRLRVQGNETGVGVEVCNPIRRGSDAMKSVLEAISASQSAESPAAAYQARITEIATTYQAGPDGSGLGLLRVAYEAGCTLEAFLEDDDILRVRALSGPIPPTSFFDAANA